jgi:hypothetical protein
MPKITLVEKQDALVAKSGNDWLGGGTGTEVQIENIWRVFSNTGGFFGPGGRELATSTGTSAVALIEGTDFEYGLAIDGSDAGGYDIYDTGDSGSFSSGKCIRVVHDGTNIASGLNLNVIAQNLSGNLAVSPTGTQCFVDPKRGKFLLPRPSYWVKMESDHSIEFPELQEGGSLFIKDYVYDLDYFTGKFGKCLRLMAETGAGTQVRMYPNGITTTLDTGSFSGWVQHYPDNNHFRIHFGGSDNYVKVETNLVSIYLSGSLVTSAAVSTDDSIFHKIYVVWDIDGSLTGGKTVRVFLDGTTTEVCSTTSEWISGYCYLIGSVSEASDVLEKYNEILLDNFKVWNHVVTEDPSWDWGGGSGIEGALHSIYGSNAVPGSLTVGYFYITKTSTPFSLDEPSGGDVEVELEDPSSYSNGFGKFGTGCSKSDYSPFVENVDFYYNEKINGGGAHSIDIWDDKDSGSLEGGTEAIRIVHETTNVATTLALIPYARSLQTIVAPAQDQVSVDPVRGSFCMPRPIFWSKMESLEDYDTIPTILDSTYAGATYENFVVTGGTLGGASVGFTTGGQWNNCLRVAGGNILGAATAELFPIGDNALSSGTASFWISRTGGTESSFYFYLTSNTYVRVQCRVGGIFPSLLHISVNGVNSYVSISPNVDSAPNYTFVYILWDSAGGMSGGATIKAQVWGGGALIGTKTVTTGGWLPDRTKIRVHPSQFASAYIDNVKLWSYPLTTTVVEDGSWDYNSGTGREDSLHPMYGASSSYKPDLHVGYYKSGSTDGLLTYTSPGEN